MMGLAVDEHSAIGAAFPERKIIDGQHTWCGWLRNRDLAGEAQQRIRAGRHGLMLALAGTCLSAKGKREMLQGSGQAVRASSSWGQQVRQWFREGLPSTLRVETPPAPDVEQQLNDVATDW
jgi:hypothetical protein